MQPIVIVPAAAPELAPAPIPQDWILSGTPEARSRQLAHSRDRASSVMAWSCTAGRFTWQYSVDETVHIIEGEVYVTDENGREHRLGPGDSAFFPAGSRSTWHVPVSVRKVAVCRQAMPRLFAFGLRGWNMLARFMKAIFWPPEEAQADPLAPKAPAAAGAPELSRARSDA
ncbi:MAG TPA: cupin domain-containing protein [Xanthobacteraceae bacterium]|jgi:uncharacterized cupin superfamily protein|nr:cupin domain-containing protein [Xanthobacteraceae bacterium]